MAHGRRTVTAALRHTGQGDTPSFSLYHQVFNRARWSALKGSRCLLSLLVQTFDAAGGSLTFVIDETLERRWGRRINKRGHYRDPLASSRKRTVSTSGLRWIVLTLVITPPWDSRCRALPILSVPAPTPQVSERLGLRHKTVAQWARGGDPVARASDYPAWSSACAMRQPLGSLCVCAGTMAACDACKISSGTALWYRSGQPVLPLRWVLVRPCDAQHPPRAFFSTCPGDRAVISWRVSSSAGALRRPSKRTVPTWALRPSVSGLTWRLNGPRRVC